jgi:hypothetical protein
MILIRPYRDKQFWRWRDGVPFTQEEMDKAEALWRAERERWAAEILNRPNRTE